VDLEIDRRLKAIGTPQARELLGQAAIANARLAYQAYEETFTGDRWDALAAAGANKQRPLWASTGVKDPAYDDTRDVVELVAPGTVNTTPEKTIDAVADHGVIRGNTIKAATSRRRPFSLIWRAGHRPRRRVGSRRSREIRTGLERTAGQCCHRTPERPPGTVTTDDDARRRDQHPLRSVMRPVTVPLDGRTVTSGATERDADMVTMRDVALRAGVSTATVSHVLNNTRKVNPTTAAAVRDAMARTGYVNDGVARAMRTGATRTIGLAMSAISNPYFGDVVHSIEELLAGQDYSLLLADTHDNPDSEKRAIADLLRQRPAGVILAPSAFPGDVVTALAARKIPLVCIDRVLPGIDSVGVENETPVQRLVGHLIDLGHRRISMVAGRQGLTTTEERIQGYTTQMTAAGLPITHNSLLHGDSRGSVARHVVEGALSGPDRPTALVVGNNQMTIGAMRALRDAGLSVPGDLALVAFDDFEWSDLFSPRLTAVAQPEREMASTAVSLLLDRMADPESETRQIRLTPTLNHRDSCGCDDSSVPL
jgi:LacI family transcriptional regulator